MDRIWVAKLSISTRTSNKIHSKHGLTDHEVRDAIVCVVGLYGWWDEDAVKGVRVLLDARIRDRPVTIVLYPPGGSGGGCLEPWKRVLR